MTLLPLSTSNSDGQNVGQINDMIRSLNNEQQVKVFKGANNVNALITGKLPNDLGYGLQFSDTNNVPRIIAYIDSTNKPVFKISDPTIDVTTASDDQLIFNSNQNVLKVVSVGTATVNHPISTFSTTVTVAHELSFIPAVLAYSTGDGGASYQQLPVSTVASTAGVLGINRYVDVSVDATNVYFTIYTGTGNIVPITRVIKYYLLQETSN